MNKKVIQWYPGHMKKADREIKEKLKQIDTIVEILDARIPLSSRNPDISEYCKNKKHIILLNKSDLADPEQTQKWINKLKEEDNVDEVISFNATDQKQRKKLVNAIKSVNEKEKRQQRCLIVGIPNVGKSTIINSLVNKRKARTGNQPGITKGQQWLISDDGFVLLDTPGILWPKFEDNSIGIRLAWIGSIKDTIFEKEDLAVELLRYLKDNYQERLEEVYDISLEGDEEVVDLYEKIATRRGFLAKNHEYDYDRVSNTLLKDFKDARFGKITIDTIER